jgi:hypothetical protein
VIILWWLRRHQLCCFIVTQWAHVRPAEFCGA